MQVLLLTDADVFAGTERHMLDLACALKEQGVNVQLACPVPSPLAEKGRDIGLKVVPIQKKGLIDWTAIRQIRRLFKAGAIDIVHAHNGRTALIASMACALAKRGQCVATQHFLEPNHASQKGPKAVLSKLAHGWVVHRTRRYIAISDAVRYAMIERGEASPEKIVTVANGLQELDIDALAPAQTVRAELGLADETPLLVCVARLEKEKGISSLIEAMVQVNRTHPHVVCVVAGKGAQEQLLRQQIEENNLEDSMKLLGFRADVRALINAADVFVLPSPAEPFGLVLLEAMALGKPVVATAAGGPLEIVVSQETGLLVTPSDSNALAQALCALLDDAALRETMGKKGRARFEEKFTAQRMAREITAVYQQALDSSVGSIR